MPIITDIQHAFHIKRYPNLSTLTKALREHLGLDSLTPDQRRRHQGRWFLNAGDFACRAAQAREDHAELLADLPFRGADIEAQRQRVAYLEDAHVIFSAFTKMIADTLLKERSELFQMNTTVLKTVEALHKNPHWARDHKPALGNTLLVLRKYFDRRNKKISQTKQKQAARLAPPQARPAPPAAPIAAPAENPLLPACTAKDS